MVLSTKHNTESMVSLIFGIRACSCELILAHASLSATATVSQSVSIINDNGLESEFDIALLLFNLKMFPELS